MIQAVDQEALFSGMRRQCGRECDSMTVGARNETGHSRVIFTVRLVYHGPSDRGNVCLP